MNFFLPSTPATIGAGADADADFQVRSIDRKVAAQQVAHGNRHVGDGGRIVVDFLIEAAGDHVGIADGLDLFQAMLFRQFVEGGEDPVQHGEYLGRRHVGGHLGEVHDVGEHDGDIGKTVGDGLVRALQAVRDGCGKNVEQQLFGALLLDQDLPMGLLEALLRLALFGDRKAQQHVDDGRHRNEVEREKDQRGAYRHTGLLCDQRIVDEIQIDHAGYRGKHHPSDEPADRLAHADAKNGADRGQQGPKQDAAGGDESPAEPLRDEGQEQEQAELADAEKLEIPRHDVEQHVAGQQKLGRQRVRYRRTGARESSRWPPRG
jgi:hypothetical protein